MLVLTRTPDGQIVIDGRITITILKVKGRQVRLGIEAPRDVPVVRGELFAQVEEPKKPDRATAPQSFPRLTFAA